MTKVIIIDDEPLARSIVQEYLMEHTDYEIVAQCGDGFQGLKAIQELEPDLIFLDVQMPKITGFEMLELVEKPIGVIFTTAFDAYALNAFEANAIDYLLKPFSQERFDKALEKWTVLNKASKHITQVESQPLETPNQHDRVVVKQGNQIKIIPIAEVIYFESADDYVKVHTKSGYFLKHKTMSYYEKTMAQYQFIRVHRSILVSVKQISRIDAYEKDGYIAILQQGAKVPVSKSGYAKLKQVLDL